MADFEIHGAATIRRVAREHPEVYLRLLRGTIPAELRIKAEHHDDSDGLPRDLVLSVLGALSDDD